MKIYTNVEYIWNDKTNKLEELSSESFNHEGDIALCGGESKRGLFGVKPSSRLGTVRRVGESAGWLGRTVSNLADTLDLSGDAFGLSAGHSSEAGQASGKKRWESEGISGVTPHNPQYYDDIQTWYDEWRDPYIEGMEDRTKRQLTDLRETTAAEKAMGMPDKIFLGAGPVLEQAQRDVEIAREDWDKATRDWETYRDETNPRNIEKIQDTYDISMFKAMLEQGQKLGMGYGDIQKAMGEESKAGFAYSGPTERAKDIAQVKTQAELGNLMAEKEKMRSTRERDLATEAAALEQAEYDWDVTARGDFETAETGYKDTLGTVLSDSITGLDVGEGTIEEIGARDLGIEQNYLAASTGTASDLWTNIVDRRVYQNLMDDIQTAREGMESARATILSPTDRG